MRKIVEAGVVQRSIKFRAWDKLHKRMIHTDFAVNYNGKAILLDTFRDEVTVIMQYTGLKDKNGNEIYEGDYLQFEDTESEYIDVGIGEEKVAETTWTNFLVVYFDHGQFMVEPIFKGELIDAVQNKLSLQEFLSDYDSNVEIDQNIYENPELLEEQDEKEKTEKK